jgi:acyl-coenzyme A thioesterase PaaI-like protein
MDIAELQRGLPGLPHFLGMRFTRVEKDIVVAEMEVR